MGWLLAGLLSMALAITAFLFWQATRPASHPLMRLTVDLGPDADAGAPNPAIISPDGTRLVYSVKGTDGQSRLATRVLNQAQPTILSGTEGPRRPFFSPDVE